MVSDRTMDQLAGELVRGDGRRTLVEPRERVDATRRQFRMGRCTNRVYRFVAQSDEALFGRGVRVLPVQRVPFVYGVPETPARLEIERLCCGRLTGHHTHLSGSVAEPVAYFDRVVVRRPQVGVGIRLRE